MKNGLTNRTVGGGEAMSNKQTYRYMVARQARDFSGGHLDRQTNQQIGLDQASEMRGTGRHTDGHWTEAVYEKVPERG